MEPVEAPRPRLGPEREHWRAVDDLVARLWRGRGGYGLGREEQAIIEASSVSPDEGLEQRASSAEAGHPASTYGEVTSVGARQLSRAMGMDCLACERPVVFMDLGSGVGKLVAQAY